MLTISQLIFDIIANIDLNDLRLVQARSKAEFSSIIKNITLNILPSYKEQILEFLIEAYAKETAEFIPRKAVKEVAASYFDDFYNELTKLIENTEIPNEFYKAWIEQKNSSSLKKISLSSEFSSNLTKAASGIPIKTALDSMLHKDKWKKDKYTSEAYYEYLGKKNPKNYVEHYINQENVEEIHKLPFDEALQLIEKFGLDTCKLHLLLSSLACTPDNPYGTAIILKGTEVIKTLGWGTNNEKQHELLTRLANTAWAVNSLLVKSEWEEGKKKDKTMVYIETSRMWEMAVGVYGQKNIYGKVDEPNEVIIQVRPGLWTTGFLNRGGAASRTAFYHFCWLSKKIMEIPQYHNELAIQIAMRESIEANYRNNYRTVESYLTENMPGATAAINEAIKYRKKRHSLKQEWDKALVTIENIGIEIIYDENTYPPELRPKATCKLPYNYFEKFLKAKLKTIPPKPNAITIATQSNLNINIEASESNFIDRVKSLEKQPKTKTITGSDIYKARVEAGVKATHLATYFKRSRAWLSQIEKGKRLSLAKNQKLAKDILKAIEVLSKNTQR